MKQSVVLLFVLIAFGGILFFSNVGGWDLWNPDEPRYAQIAKEMLQGEGWIIPHLNSEVYTDKPPLFFWLIASASKGLGELNETAARLPSAVFALFTIILTLFLGKRLFSEKVGFFAALILATNGEFFWLARRASIDVTLTFFTTSAIFLFFIGFREQKSKRLFYTMAYCAMAVGVLTKLQVGVIVPFLVVSGYFILQRESRFFKDLSHIPGMALFTLIIGGWLYGAYLSGGVDYLWGLLYHKTASTFFDTTSHPRPLYYYFVNFPGDFLLWSVFLPSALIYGFSSKVNRKGFFFVFFWFLIIFIFFSLAKAKRELYLLPLYPAASLMVGYLWGEFSTDAERKMGKLIAIPLSLLSGVLVSMAVGLPIAASWKGSVYLEHPWEISLISSLILGGGGALCYVSYYYRRRILPFYVMVAMTLASGLFATMRIFPEIDSYKSARPLSQTIISVMRPPDQLAIYRFEGAEFNYYTGINPIRKVYDKEELQGFLSSHQRVFCILQEKHYAKLEKDIAPQSFIIIRGKVGHRPLVVISNREI
jgi:4-amino-4-deoxy-L-arabinose transferase-like glycosyltransferase